MPCVRMYVSNSKFAGEIETPTEDILAPNTTYVRSQHRKNAVLLEACIKPSLL